MNHLFGVNWEYPWVLVAVPILPFVAWTIFRGKLGRSAPLSLPKIMRRWAGVRAVVDRPGAARGPRGTWLGAGAPAGIGSTGNKIGSLATSTSCEVGDVKKIERPTCPVSISNFCRMVGKVKGPAFGIIARV